MTDAGAPQKDCFPVLFFPSLSGGFSFAFRWLSTGAGFGFGVDPGGSLGGTQVVLCVSGDPVVGEGGRWRWARLQRVDEVYYYLTLALVQCVSGERRWATTK